MTRPASLRPTHSPILAQRKEKGSKALGLDWEHLEPSYNHKLENDLNLETLSRLRRELNQAEAIGAYSKSKKLRREINRQLEQGLSIRATWCGGCNNYLHRCQCPGLAEIMN